MAAYYPTIPEIAKAYEGDPRQRIAIALQQQGSNTAPVAGGNYAWLDGIARALSGVASGIIQKRVGREYQKREGKYTNEIARAFADPSVRPADPAAALVQQPPAAPPPMASGQPDFSPGKGMGPTMSGYGGGTFDMSGRAVPLYAPMPNLASQMPAEPLRAIDPDAGAGLAAPRAAPPTPMAPAPAQAAPSPPADAEHLFRNGIVPIEGGTDRDGRFRTSPKGAYGPSQLMPGTAPEAMALAGFSRDDNRWRTDAKVNLAAGQAYYAKQLETFGDPIKAAAAYNAGPGRVNRAQRRASREGGSWTDYLPGETKAYVQNFAARVGDSLNGTGGETVAANAPAAMEAVPAGVADPGAAPKAPEARPAVQSSKLRIARSLLASKNPDVYAMGLKMAQEGLGEEFEAESNYASRADAAAARGYSTEAADWQNARSEFRGGVRDDRRGAMERNFGRENREDQQQYGTSERIGGQNFQAGENAAERAWRTADREDQQRYGTSERIGTQVFQADQNERNRDSREQIAQQRRSDFFSKPQGQDVLNRVKANNAAIDDLTRYKELNQEQGTGWASKGVLGGIRATLGDDELAEMRAITNRTTIADSSVLKGALSDSDRKFVLEAQPNTGLDRKSNTNIIDAKVAALRRQNEFEMAQSEAVINGDVPTFMQQWEAYKSRYSVRDTEAPSFVEWKSRNVIDARGRK